jgi:hypothetical protein
MYGVMSFEGVYIGPIEAALEPADSHVHTFSGKHICYRCLNRLQKKVASDEPFPLDLADLVGVMLDDDMEECDE